MNAVSARLNFTKYPKDDIVEHICRALDAHKSIGFDAVDIDLEVYHLRLDSQTEEIKAMIQYSKQIGMPFRLTHLPFSLNDPQRLRDAIDITKLMGAECTVIHPPAPNLSPEEFDEEREHDRIVSSLAPFIEYADQVGVTVTVENMRQIKGMRRYCSDPETLCKVADELGVGICWDTGHAHTTGLKQSDALKHVGNRLKMIHVNDNYGSDDLHLAPFVGTVDWQDVMQGLSAVSFEGLFNYEVSTRYMPDEVCVAFGKYLCSAAQKLLSMMK